MYVYNKECKLHIKKQVKHNCEIRESNPGPLAPQSAALPLGHRVN